MKNMIEVSNVSKKFLIHKQKSSYGTLIETISNGMKQALKKISNPFKSVPSPYEDFWSLKDVSFDIQEGDKLGIIGRNGAGKSTLLKLLSRIMVPTSGIIKIKGRVASLLEVGVGFHLELTGRENIYLNGAILGMTKKEITKKFDEIVEFGEIASFLETPVKRYSSGMYAKLGFAIAAHVDPDILIVDEVLAVGDLAFQKKCLKKMNELGTQGRTILFVSHDPGSVLSLCNKGLYLEKGKVKNFGSIENCINHYLKTNCGPSLYWEGEVGDEIITIHRAYLQRDDLTRDFFYQGEKTKVNIEYTIDKFSEDLILGINVYNSRNQIVAKTHIYDDLNNLSKYRTLGKHKIHFTLDAGMFHEGDYRVVVTALLYNQKLITQDEISLKFSIYPPSTNIRFKTEGETAFLGSQWCESEVVCTV
ncbi:MAG: hypothetical protein BGO10_08120 [Chlamydia sp. 32-24]|nr:MAG: hypothetical protein BGO10_08120 [Chlamydia sp. 32-24]